MKHFKKSKHPLTVVTDTDASSDVKDSEDSQRLLDLAAQADASEGIRQAREVLEAFRRSHAIPRPAD